MWLIELGFYYHLILKHKFFTTVIFIGSASTVHKSLKIMF